jgi:hypothetical protein
VSSPPRDVTQLLLAWSGDDRGALADLIPVVYGELRRIVTRYLRHERAGHTLQATALVHEAYFKLGLSPATVKRQWAVARAWLLHHLHHEAHP